MDNVIIITKPNPRISANIFSKILFGWMIPICYVGVKRSLLIDDLYECLKSDKSEELTNKLEKKWYEELENAKKKSKYPNLGKAIIKVFGPAYMILGILIFLINVMLKSYQPTIFASFIRLFSLNGEGSLDDKLIYGTILIGISTISVFTTHQFDMISAHIGMRIRVACCSLVYRKLLRLHTKSLHETAAGQLVNLLSNDVSRFDLVLMYLHYIWILPIQVPFLTYLIWRETGVSSIIGVAAMLILTLPVQGGMAKLASKYRLQVAQKTDKRITLMGQLIEGVQVIKMYVWENALAETVKKLRSTEVKSLTKAAIIRAILSAMSVFMERFITFITIISFVLLGNTITAEIVFSLALFYNVLQLTTAIYYPLALLFLSETKVTIQRLQDFLLLDEKEELKLSFNNHGSVILKNVEAFWNLKIPTLKNITINIPKGSLCAVVGPVGSGKSTFLQLLLGEVSSFNGTVEIGGNVSYASQGSWIFASTVRKNILFGQKFDKLRYKEVVSVCALKTDFERFPYKDKTVIGDKGISLSGGQRARINLARAVYRKADIYLLDDPLSAVDAHVGKDLFENCIVEYLQKKTRILVTHQLQYLKKADKILVLDTTGKIEACGSFAELSKSTLDFTKFLSSAEDDDEEEEPRFERRITTASIMSAASENWEEEQLEKNAESIILEKSPYWQYAKSATNVCGLVIIAFSMIIAQIVTSGTDYWTSYWTKLEEKRSINTTEYTVSNSFEEFLTTEISMYIYFGLIVGTIVLVTYRSLLFNLFSMSASRNLHDNMFTSLLKAPMSFFDTNPMGRVLNRFSKDMGVIDELIPRLMLDTIAIILIMCGIIINVIITNYWMSIAGVILGIIFVVIVKWYMALARRIRLVEGASKSPVFSHLNATFNGLVTVRSTKTEIILKKEFDQHQDTHSSAWFLTLACIYAFGLWLDIISLIFIICVVYSFIYLSTIGLVSGSAVGLAVQQSLNLLFMLTYGMRQMAQMVSNMTAVERVLEYTRLEKEENTNEKQLVPTSDWPYKGAIDFKNLSLYYSLNDPAVLKNLNFTIEAGEKIGIVGRTGAGKTSLIGAVFRLAKLTGQIFIDGVDTQVVPLGILRKKISIIPQEPVLFSETMRYNLDPFNEYDDQRLWTALEEVELKEAVPSLGMIVQEGGCNFSTGQRQLICLARAILRSNKVLVLDEATANVDPRTDALIQKTIRKRFKLFTVLTIAHRLNTVMDSDKVLVMDSGNLVEFDHPYTLLQNKDGILFKLVSQTGPSMEAFLHKVAEDSYLQKLVQSDI